MRILCACVVVGQAIEACIERNCTQAAYMVQETTKSIFLRGELDSINTATQKVLYRTCAWLYGGGGVHHTAAGVFMRVCIYG